MIKKEKPEEETYERIEFWGLDSNEIDFEIISDDANNEMRIWVIKKKQML